MQKRRIFSIVTLVLIFGAGFNQTMAGAMMSSIRANIKYDYKYWLDGKIILAGKPAIIYDNVVYVPLNDLARTLGYNTAVQGDGATLTSPGTPSLPVPPSGQATDILINRAIISAIDFSSNQITVYPENSPNNLIRLNVTPSTRITYGTNSSNANFVDLAPGMVVRALHSPAVSKSNPPQANATSITILSTPIQPR
ncbi:MAG: hypothetical protein ATN36_08160 [Epulopiscium sp. Nele67-Bin005]|nr:MAG: hypothetical protein ATN36_08160 [Epulopiscium sp. Nele67-Bin005]